MAPPRWTSIATLPARRGLAHEAAELTRAAHVLAVEARDHVPFLDARSGRRALGPDALDLRALRSALDLFEADPEEATAPEGHDPHLLLDPLLHLDALVVTVRLAGPDGSGVQRHTDQRENDTEHKSGGTLHQTSFTLPLTPLGRSRGRNGRRVD